MVTKSALIEIAHPHDRLPSRTKPKYRIKLAQPYEAEKDYTSESFKKDSQKHFEESVVRVKPKDEHESIEVYATISLLKLYRDGKRVLVESTPEGKVVTQESDITLPADHAPMIKIEKRLITSVEQLKKLADSDEWNTSKLLEQFPVDFFGQDLDFSRVSGAPPNDEFIPILGGPFNKQLYLYDYLLAHAKCFEQKNHNPLAKAIVDIMTNFVIGKGVKLQFKNADCQRVWDDFEERTNFQELIKTDSDTLVWAGEIMTRKTRTADGAPFIKQLDPSTVWEIVTKPEDIDQVFYYHRQFPTQYQLIYQPKDVVSRYVIEDIPADEMFHVKVNAVPGEKRGRADLFVVLTALKQFRDYMNAKVQKARLEESYSLDVSVDGSDQDVQAVLNDQNSVTNPPPGSMLIHNKAITYEYKSPTLSSTGGGDNAGEQLRAIIATGLSFAPEWLGVGGTRASRATSITKSEPGFRKIERRQQVMERYIRNQADWVMEVEMERGELKPTQLRKASFAGIKKALKQKDWKGLIKEATGLLKGLTIGDGQLEEELDKSFEVIFPEINTDDRHEKITDIALAESLKYFTHERAANMVAKELAVTSYDYDEEMEGVREEQENQAELMPEMNPSQFMGKGGAGGGAPKFGGPASDSQYKDQAGEL